MSTKNTRTFLTLTLTLKLANIDKTFMASLYGFLTTLMSLRPHLYLRATRVVSAKPVSQSEALSGVLLCCTDVMEASGWQDIAEYAKVRRTPVTQLARSTATNLKTGGTAVWPSLNTGVFIDGAWGTLNMHADSKSFIVGGSEERYLIQGGLPPFGRGSNVKGNVSSRN